MAERGALRQTFSARVSADHPWPPASRCPVASGAFSALNPKICREQCTGQNLRAETFSRREGGVSTQMLVSQYRRRLVHAG